MSQSVSPPRSPSTGFIKLPPIISNDLDRKFLTNLSEYIERELSEVNPDDPGNRFVVHQAAFNKVQFLCLSNQSGEQTQQITPYQYYFGQQYSPGMPTSCLITGIEKTVLSKRHIYPFHVLLDVHVLLAHMSMGIWDLLRSLNGAVMVLWLIQVVTLDLFSSETPVK